MRCVLFLDILCRLAGLVSLVVELTLLLIVFLVFQYLCIITYVQNRGKKYQKTQSQKSISQTPIKSTSNPNNKYITNKKKPKKMHELITLIQSRIHDIKQLQCQTQPESLSQSTPKNPTKLHELILKQKNGQEYRNRKEMEILSTVNLWNLAAGDREVQELVYRVCGDYDGKVRDEVEAMAKGGHTGGNAREGLVRVLKGFFHRNGYREKIGYLNSIFDRSHSKMPAGIIFSLLSQWSKKRYLAALSIRIKDIKSRYQIQPQLSYSSSTHKLTHLQPPQYLPQPPQKKSLSLLSSQPHPHTHPHPTSSNTDILQKIPKLNSNKLLTIYNRATLYGYLVDQLEQYYSLTGIEELDRNYVRLLPKRKMKENLGYVENVNRAVEVLIQVSMNKQQRVIIRDYLAKYRLYHQEIRKIKVRKMEDKNTIKNKSVRTMSDHIPSTQTKTNQQKKLSVDLQIFRDGLNGQGYGFSIQLQPNMSSSLLNMPRQRQRFQQQSQQYEHLKQSLIKKLKQSENSENLHNFNKMENKNKIKFPTLSRSMDKKEKCQEDYVEKSKLYRFPTNEDQAQAEQDQETKSSLFKFSQRQTIKGIIIKNFLSNREKQKMSKLKQSEEEQLYIKNKQEQNNKRIASKMQTEERKVSDFVDIRSLRQKTRALLKNFRTIQNY